MIDTKAIEQWLGHILGQKRPIKEPIRVEEQENGWSAFYDADGNPVAFLGPISMAAIKKMNV